MNENELSILIDEMREEFQIPPYYDDRQLRNLAKEGEYAVGRLNPGCSITKDLTYRMLMKNYMYHFRCRRMMVRSFLRMKKLMQV